MMAAGKPGKARFERLLSAMHREGLDAAAIVPGANFYFLTGVQFHLMERPTVLFVLADGSKHAVIPSLESARWKAAAPDVDSVFWQDSDGFADAFKTLSGQIAPRRIGVEGQRMRVFEGEAIRAAFGAGTVVDAHAAISRMRLHKDKAEIDAMRKAVAISEAALRDTLARVRVGQSEAEIRQGLIADMLAHGADGPAFEPIVLAGGAAADPHGTAQPDRRLKAGDALLFDWGAAWGGYAADITRTFFVGEVSQRHRDIYEAVRAANAVGRAVAAPGVSLHDLDAAVGGSMRDAGFADLIVHKTGHGLGLDIHEAPQVMAGNMDELEPGMVITIEPGLYRDGDVGVRIEDDVVITADGAESLTTFDRSLTLVG